jgi:outer membrane receptor protein involved in Fe transport
VSAPGVGQLTQRFRNGEPGKPRSARGFRSRARIACAFGVAALLSSAWAAEVSTRIASTAAVGEDSLAASRLDPLVVTAARTAQSVERVPVTVRQIDQTALRSTPALTLDGALRSVPSFSLFRRSDSLTANPTAQGVSLRGLGPSGASRSLVLLDGVPLNDPFGGWVAWTKIPRESIGRVEVVPGGGATAWGNAALGGVVQLLSDDSAMTSAIAVNGRFSASAGDFRTRNADLIVTGRAGAGSVQLLASDFTTNGFSLVAPERRGPIDVAAWSRHRSIIGRWREPIGEKAALTVTARGYEEFRGNGTPYQRNGSREKFISTALGGDATDMFSWNAVAYGQDQSFASTFSSVNAARTAETPASDQFAVPAVTAGAGWTGAWRQANGARTSGGADMRFVRGETRENFTFSNGAFTRQRVAGGAQSLAGAFATREQPVATGLRVTLGARLDAWRDTDGHRRETDRASGALLRNDRYDDRAGIEVSPSAGLVWTPANTWRVWTSAQHGFRRPTLNELYRPFRQGANVTETNPALRTERVTSAEIGTEWALFPRTRTGVANSPSSEKLLAPRPSSALVFNAAAFWNELRDAVGNVTLARGPGTFPLFGTLPAGGTGRQRLNLDRMRVQGIDFSVTWTPVAALSITASGLYNDATVRQASVAPALVGKRVAQVPQRNAALAATWHAPAEFVVTARLRWIGRQFEDDENTLRLGETTVIDLGLSRRLTRRVEGFLTVENAGNARVETGRSADGVVNIGTPRLAIAGVRGTW